MVCKSSLTPRPSGRRRSPAGLAGDCAGEAGAGRGAGPAGPGRSAEHRPARRRWGAGCPRQQGGTPTRSPGEAAAGAALLSPPRAGAPARQHTRKGSAGRRSSVLPLPQRNCNSEVLPEPRRRLSHAGTSVASPREAGGGEGRQGRARGRSPRQLSLLPAPGAASPAAASPALPAYHLGGLVNRRRPGVTARNYEVATGAGSPIAA